MRPSRCRATPPLSRQGTWLASLGLLLTALLFAQRAGASPYYEMGEAVHMGTGHMTVGDPVDLATGAFMVQEPIAYIPGRVPIDLSWIFTSQDNSSGPLGTGTALSTDFAIGQSSAVPAGYSLCAPGNLQFLFLNPSGDNKTYSNSTDPEVLGATLTFATARPSNDLTSTLRWKDGSIYRFDSTGALYRMEDRLGNFLSIYRNSKGYPTEIRQPSGRSVVLTYGANNLLASVTLPLDRTWQFGYDSASPPHLSRVTDPTGAHMDYTWSSYVRSDGGALPLVLTCADRLGNRKVANSYDSQGRVVLQAFPDGGTERISYSGAIGQNGSTTVTDPNKNIVERDYAWNPAGFGYNLNKIVDYALNETTTITRGNSPSNLVTSITNYLNQTVSFGWDFTKGNLTSLTVPTTSATAPTVLTSATWSFQYDPTFSQLTVVAEPAVSDDSLVRQTQFTVDPNTGNTTAIRDPMGFVTTLAYAKNGDLISVTDEMQAQTRFSYSPEGDLQLISDPLNNVTLLFHDDASRLTGIRDANGKQTWLQYTPLDDVSQVTRYLNSLQVVTGYQYDAEQNLRFLTDPLGRVREWRYDSKNRPIQAIDALGQSTFAYWDLNDNLLKWVDRKGQVGAYSYGIPASGDRLVSATFYANNGVNSGATPESSYSVSYDSTSHLVSGVTEYAGGAVSNTFGYKYDAAWRLIEEDWTEPSYSLRSVVQALDEAGRRTSLTVNGATPITYAYTPRDQVSQIAQGGTPTQFQYDRTGRLIQRTLTNGVSTAWSFNAAGFLTGLTSSAKDGTAIDTHSYTVDAVGNITRDVANSLTQSYVLDDLYRLTQATIGSTTYNWMYDLVGNRLSQTAGSSQTLYGFDANNRMVSVNGAPLSYL